MKIAYIYDGIYPYVGGGAEKRFWELAVRLARKGHEVHIYGRDPGTGEPYFVKDGVHIHAVSAHLPMYSPQGTRSISQVICFSLGIIPNLWRNKFDIVDTNAFPYLNFFFVKIYCFFRKVPLVVTWQEVWGSYWYKYLGFWKGSAGRFVERLVIAFTRDVIVYAPSIRDQLQRYPGKRNTRIIPNGIDLAYVDSVNSDREKFDLIFVGRLIRDKHVEMVLKTVRLLKEENPELRCLIIGFGPEKQNLTRLAADLGIERQVSFREGLEYEKVISLMKAGKVFLFPSAREGFGIAVIEAQACGLPVVLADFPMNAAVELVSDGLTGYVCEPDEKDFAGRVKLLLNDDKLRGVMSLAARRSVEIYDWDHVAEMNEEFYKQVSAKSAGAKP